MIAGRRTALTRLLERAGRVLEGSLLVLAAFAPKHLAADPSTAPRSDDGWKLSRFAVENESARTRVALTGYVQGDLRAYPNWTDPRGEDGSSLRAPAAEWTRMRLGVEGHWKRFEFQVEVGPDRGRELKNAWLGLRLRKDLLLHVGRQKLATSQEYLTGNQRTDLLERAVFADRLAAQRDQGVQLLREGRRLDFQGGIFLGDESPSSRRAGTTLAGRVVVRPLGWLELGVSGSRGEVEAQPAAPGLEPKPKGFPGRSATEYEFFEPLFVAGTRRRLGCDAGLRRGPFALGGEYLRRREERRGQGPALEDLPALVGSGFSVTSTWLVTGEHKARSIRPRRPLPHGPGAVELALRYQELHADDVANAGPEGLGSRAANPRAAGLSAMTLGVSWWPVSLVRVMGNALVERYTDPLSAPEPGRRGRYVSLLARLQVMLP